MESKDIVIKGARENNLKNIDLTIPKNKLVVFTGVSGSGKSTLAFDTIYSEGQRRYVESLSSYARQFLGSFEKPDVDSIEGLSPAISIDQKTTSHNPRSTVGTVTEIYDYLRLLYARIGVAYCPTHHEPILKFSIKQMVEKIMAYPEGSKLVIEAPVVRNEKGSHVETMARFLKNGYNRMRIDKGLAERFEYVPELDPKKKHFVDFVVDRLILSSDSTERLTESLRSALDLANGYAAIVVDKEEVLFSEFNACPICGFSVPELEPRLFSFNSPLGCCPDCHGLGSKLEVSPDLLVPNKNLSLIQGAIPYLLTVQKHEGFEWQEFVALCEHFGIPMNIPFRKLTPEQQEIIFMGPKIPFTIKLEGQNGSVYNKTISEGIKVKINRLYNQTTSSFMRDYYLSFMTERECPTCHGARLNEKVLSVRIGGLNIHEMCSLSFDKLLAFFEKLELNKTDAKIAELVLKEIKARLGFLINVGLEYLTLSRVAMSLSGGESQRIRLATQIGSHLTGVLYVLDEPSIGLHQRDNDKLITSLKEMRDLGNSLIVVEHDEDTMLAADYLVDIGPGAGDNGGEVVACGTPEEVMNNPASLTGRYLKGELFIPVPEYRATGNGHFISIKNARCHNLKNIDVDIPLGEFVAITGVSGSGKSSLVTEILYKSLLKQMGVGKETVGECDDVEGLEYIDKVINVSQDPIGKTPRSNPATYIGVFDDIRDLFASTRLAKMKGFDKGYFSFNNKGGRCETCNGDGVKKISMNFLPDVYVTCEECHGKRYSDETLEVTYKGKNIYDILNMRVTEAYEFFEFHSIIARKIKTLIDVGLGYIRLGQSSTTLSGGEAQRVKLAFELQKRPTGKTIYILDEPTTGLHTDDVKKLLEVLKFIVASGNSVVVIEHNLDVVKSADYIIDLGPDGGDKGGYIVATGTPEEVSKNKNSYTGMYLKKLLKK